MPKIRTLLPLKDAALLGLFVMVFIISISPYRFGLYKKLVLQENKTWDHVKDFANINDITFMVALPILEEELREGRQPYQASEDGHPNATGHAALARELAAFFAVN